MPSFDAAAIAHHEEILHRSEAHLSTFLEQTELPVIDVQYESLAASPREELKSIATVLRPDLSVRQQEKRVERSLNRARVIRGESRESSEWHRRFLEETGS